jgi:hypothetical protein
VTVTEEFEDEEDEEEEAEDEAEETEKVRSMSRHRRFLRFCFTSSSPMRKTVSIKTQYSTTKEKKENTPTIFEAWVTTQGESMKSKTCAQCVGGQLGEVERTQLAVGIVDDKNDSNEVPICEWSEDSSSLSESSSSEEKVGEEDEGTEEDADELTKVFASLFEENEVDDDEEEEEEEEGGGGGEEDEEEDEMSES